jgi:hypothetical protein
MKNAVFWDVIPRGSCKNRRSYETSVPTITIRHNIKKNAFFNGKLDLTHACMTNVITRPGMSVQEEYLKQKM